jgi:hypothetical protein
VIKHLPERARHPGRFYDDAVHMQDLNGTPGILPVLAIDCARPDKPRLVPRPATSAPLDSFCWEVEQRAERRLSVWVLTPSGKSRDQGHDRRE